MKRTIKKFQLRREVIRSLTSATMKLAAGGRTIQTIPYPVPDTFDDCLSDACETVQFSNCNTCQYIPGCTISIIV